MTAVSRLSQRLQLATLTAVTAAARLLGHAIVPRPSPPKSRDIRVDVALRALTDCAHYFGASPARSTFHGFMLGAGVRDTERAERALVFHGLVHLEDPARSTSASIVTITPDGRQLLRRLDALIEATGRSDAIALPEAPASFTLPPLRRV